MHILLEGDTIISDLIRGIGGSELNNTLRSILTVKNGEDPAMRYLTVTKMSFLGKEMTLVAFVQDEDYRTSYVFDDETAGVPVDLNTEDAAETSPNLSIAERTVAFARELLSDSPMDSREFKKKIKEAGFSMPTLNRHKEEAGIISETQPDKSSLWRLK